MSEQETQKSEILMGMRSKYSDGTPISCLQDVYTLYIGGEMVCSQKHLGGGGYKTTCKENAAEFGERMRANGVSEYDIINGQRMRHTTHERVPCHRIPDDGVMIFRETLDAKLRE